jgi:Beta-galactosidase
VSDARLRAIGIMLGLSLVIHAQTSQDLRGIYVSGTDFPVSKQVATGLAAALTVPGVDGLLLGIAWDTMEPGMGQYDFSTLDQWMSLAVSLGRKVKLSLPAHSAPAWLFQPAPDGAGATPLTFSYAPHDALKGCSSETIAAPWDPTFLAQWDAMLAAVAAHLKFTGTYSAITAVNLTGINYDSGELHLASQTPQSGGLACVSAAPRMGRRHELIQEELSG